MEPKDFFRVVLRRKRTVVTAIIIVVGVAMFGSMKKPDQFQATCRVLIQAVGPDVLAEKGAPSIEVYSSFPTIKAVIESPRMAQRVADLLKVPYARVGGRISAGLLPSSTIFEMKTFDSDQRFVSTLCNGYAAAIIQDRRESAHKFIAQVRTTLISESKELYAQLDDVRTRATAAAKRGERTVEYQVEEATILSQLRDYQIRLTRIRTQEELIDEGGGQALTTAPPLGVKLGPNHKKDAMLALMVGLIFGLALAFVREYLDDTMRDKDSIARELGLPVLATMPAEGGVTGYVDPSSKAVEAARSLRTNLGSLGFPNELRALVVTSTLSKRRANTVANLAAAVAEAGRTVLVIGADFRNPRLHEHFGVGNAIGLSSVVRGQMSIDQAVRPVPGLDGVYLLPTGPQVSNPGELLASDAMEDLLDDACHWADAVIIDAPPVLTAADASVLGTMADGVVLVMSAGRTQREQAIEAKDQLVAGGANLLGIVLSGSSDAQGSKGLSLTSFRKDAHDEDDLPPLMPYGAWAGAGGTDWGTPAMYETPLPARRATATRARSTKAAPARSRNGSRNGGGSRNGNGGGYAARNGGTYRNGGNGNGARNGNGTRSRNGNGNGYARTSGNGSRNGDTHRNGNGARSGNGNGARSGNGGGAAPRSGTGSRNGETYGYSTRGRNGGAYAPARNGGGNGRGNGGYTRTASGRNGNGNGNGSARRTGNGTARTSNGTARTGNGTARTGNGNGAPRRNGNGTTRKVVAARRTRRDW